ncbi:apoptotic protease-activating factor 1 isoform X2 [Ooceraea biroi]|uniref:apoptotic protease-activating factor 1 isoform X2 n=1 Tax=Ooceraea biroi TaxID=2015173 RepID=UPI0005B9CAF7|nr:apoptotic protease-activating factor 1 isoform X2 [Ooceraea biroi]
MDVSHQDILSRLRMNIVQDLNIENGILQQLQSEYILKDDDIKYIYIGATKEERAERLLDLLPKCGACAFDVFHESLKHHYDWLSDEIDKLLGNYEIETNGEIDYYAGPPNVPPLSPLTVTRKEKLKMALRELNPTEYIVLHGMKGFGKSCLAASTLKDIKLVKNLFCNKVYWIKFTCNRLIDEEILIQLNTLYHNVRNLEIQPESFKILEKDALIRFFKHYFNKEENRNALLILDDVSDKKIIETFDFDCKTLVLTADIDILRRKRPKITIQMNDGFTESETLGLFAKVLEMDVNKLPIEAKRIHEECKGMPLLIAMFAAQFEEFKHDMKIQPNRWKYYLDCLRKKDATNKVMREFFQKQETIFDMSIEQLKPDLREHYTTIAVFSEDVNITPKTLEILWGQNIFHVEELMLDLCHKSLAAKKWNKDLKTYVYGVHDLLLCHLRKKLTNDELTQLHKSVIEKYRAHCANDFSKLPDDNYIYSYIGHHLEQAELFSKFRSLYLNFDFIQAKIMYAGLNDLLLDLRKYRQHITLCNKEYEAKVFDLERFLQEQASVIGQHRRKKCLDIIQIAMKHPYDDYVAQTAKHLAMKRQQYVYLYHDNVEHVNMPLTEEISTGIYTSSFTDNPDLILSGNTSGKIILWNCESKQQKVFNGHSDDCFIKKIIVSANGDCFLSLSSNGVIKLFPLSDNEMFDQKHMQVESPRQKQSCWSGFFANFNEQDDSLMEFSVRNEIILDMVFGHRDKCIAACTDKGTIQIWDRYGESIFTLSDIEKKSLTRITFTVQGLLLNVMEESGVVFWYAYSENDYNTTYRYISCYNLQLKNEKVIFLHNVPEYDDSLVIVTEKEAMLLTWTRNMSDENQVYKFNKVVRTSVEDDSVTYVCATRTHDSAYLIVADSAGFINVWNIFNGLIPVATYRSHVTSLDTYWLKEEGYHIICGNDNKLLYRWKLPIVESDKSPRNYLFDAIAKPLDEVDIVVKESHPRNIVALYGEKVKEFEYRENNILSLHLSPDGREIVYVTENHAIMLLNIETDETKLVSQVDKPVKFVKIINIDNTNLVVFGWLDDYFNVWQHSNPMCKIESKGCIAHIHALSNYHVMTITQNGIMTLWRTIMPWRLMSQETGASLPNTHISFTCLSHHNKYLAIIKEPNHLIVYTLYEDAEVMPSMKLRHYYNHGFSHRVTCCDISQNEQYIAVGLQTGLICIIDIKSKTEITKLSFHNNSIAQLSWAPVTIDVPILFSLTNDEMVWWNIALVKNNAKRRSRMGISHSTSTPSLSTSMPSNFRIHIPNSQSVDTGVANLQDGEKSTADVTNVVSDVSRYWRGKIGKNPEIPELLTVVELPPSRNVKVCISPDFDKYVTVDTYGSIYTFKLID